jgi:hypothetical protein
MTTLTGSRLHPIAAYPRGGALQIWSAADGLGGRPDVFQLEDGRIAKITGPASVDAERDRYNVQILSSPHHMSTDPHRSVTGSCGLMYRHRASGAWELYPTERAYGRCDRPAPRNGLSHELSATPRQAAAVMIVQSDEASREAYYAVARDGHKIGAWIVEGMAPFCDGLSSGIFRKCGPGSVTIRPFNGHGAYFVATRYAKNANHDIRQDTFRIVVLPEPMIGGGQEMRCSVLYHEFGYPYNPPAAVLNHCVSRCRW